MTEDGVRRSDRATRWTIGATFVFGTLLVPVGIYLCIHPITSESGKGALNGPVAIFFGSAAILTAWGELRHRLRHGPAPHGRRIKDD